MTQSLRHIVIRGLHGWLDFDVTFQEGINVFYGRNGTGKTTLLHVIANLLGDDVIRFLDLRFKEISATFANGQEVQLRQTRAEISRLREVECFLNGESLGKVNRSSERNAEVHGELPPHREIGRRLRQAIELRPTYFPAFRSILEVTPQVARALDTRYVDRYLAESKHFSRRAPNPFDRQIEAKTALARELFGPFIPEITYPSPLDVQTGIDAEVSEALLKVATANRKLFSSTFVSTLDAVIDGVSAQTSATPEQLDQTLGEIQSLLEQLDEPTMEAQQTYRELAERVEKLKFGIAAGSSNSVNDILLTYKQALQSRLEEQRRAFASLQAFLDSVNSFLEGKELKVIRLPEDSAPSGLRRRRRQFIVQLGNKQSESLDVLSSGERQLVCMIYAATHVAGADSVGADSVGADSAVLIDEPELSLHIAWQRRLLTEMMRQMGTKQIIVCTHSPDIGGDHLRAVQELDDHPITSLSRRHDHHASSDPDDLDPGTEDGPDFELQLPQ